MSYHYYTFPHWTPAIYPSALVDPCGLTPDTIYIYGNPISPIDLPEHARCVHIIKTNRCNEGCYGTGGDRGLVLCSNHECWGHDTISSPACYTYLRLQPRQRYPESVEANFRAARRLLRETSESSQLAPVEEVRQQRNPPKEVFRQAAERDIGNILWSGTRAPVWAVDENEGPYVFRRPPRAPVEGLDDDQEILLDTVDEDVQAGLWEEATQEHSRVQHIPGEEAQEDLTAPLKRSQRLDEAEKEVQEINRFMDTLRLPRDAPIPASLKSKVEKIIAMYDEMDQGQTLENDNFIEEEEQKARGDRQFIAQKAACFAQEEDELTKQEDIYRIRDSVEDPQPPLATTYEGLAERDARIEARRRRVIAHQYRNSVVTSTMTPNVIDPSKTSLENPILNVAIDQFLAQDNAQLGKLDEKLTELSEIILSRSKKLGMASAGNYSTIRDHDHSNSTRFDEASTVADSDEETLTKCCVNCKDPSIDLEHPAQQLNGVVSSVKELKDKMVSMDSELACMTETLARAKKLAMAQEANITLVREAAQHRDEVLEEVAQRRKEIFKQLHRICNPELTTKAKGKPPVFNAVSVEDEVKHILRFTMPRPQEQEYTSSQPPKTEDPCVAVTGEAVAEKTKKVRFPDHDDTSTPPKYRGMGKKFSWMSAAAPRTTVVGPSGTQKASTARNLITTNTESADSVEPGTLDPETRSKVCKFSVEKKEEMLKTLRRLEELLMDSLNSLDAQNSKELRIEEAEIGTNTEYPAKTEEFVNVESLRDAQVEGFDILERVRRQLVGAAGDDEFTKLQRKAAEYISFVQANDAQRPKKQPSEGNDEDKRRLEKQKVTNATNLNDIKQRMSLLVSSQLKEIDILSSRTNSSCSDASPSSQPVEPVEGENFNWIDSETDSEDNVVYTGRSTGYEKEGKEIPDMEEEIPDMEEEIQNVDEEEIGDIDEELRKMDEEDAIRNGS